MAEKERKFGKSTTYFPFEAGSEHSFQNGGYTILNVFWKGSSFFGYVDRKDGYRPGISLWFSRMTRSIRMPKKVV